jgi:ankyrin repeat protein
VPISRATKFPYETVYSLIKLLIEHGADYNATDKEGRTPLMLAFNKDQPKIVQLLLECPEIDVNVEDKQYQSALDYAVELGNLELLQHLLRHPAFDVLQTLHSSMRALYYAIEYEDIGKVQSTLVHFQKRLVNLYGESIFQYNLAQPFKYALFKKSKAVIEVFKQFGFRVN